MAQEPTVILSNMFRSDFIFNTPIPGLDFFEIKGVAGNNKYELLGNMVGKIQSAEKRSFAQYILSPNQYFAVGPLEARPSQMEYKLDSMTATYVGKRDLPPTHAGKRALTSLLNKLSASRLHKQLWSPTGHSFYPKKGEDLDSIYPGCGLTLYRGPSFRYNVMPNGSIHLSLDSSTHYTRSSPFLEEIRRARSTSGTSLEWIREEIRRAKKLSQMRRRQFSGLHFFYSLVDRDVVIEDVDERPISEIPVSETGIDVNGKMCTTIAQYLKAKYPAHPGIRALDENQPGLVGNGYTYAPQFLFQTMSLDQIHDNILNEQTFYMDTVGRRDRDNQKPARSRWNIIESYFNQYGFESINLGSIKIRFNEPLSFPATNRFEMPKLKTADPRPVPPTQREMELALKYGFYKPPRIGKIYIYSVANNYDTKNFYQEAVKFAREQYAFKLPENYVPLEPNLDQAYIQLQKSIQTNGREGAALLGIISEGNSMHENLTNMCGEMKIPSKMVTSTVAKEVCRGKRFYLRDTLASLFTRSGGVPWILHDPLHYDCYAAVDVGRSISEWWAMGIVSDKTGGFAVSQGKMNYGEDLDEQSMSYCLSQAFKYAQQSDNIIYLRDGDVYEQEREAFEKCLAEYPSCTTAAIVSIKKSGPYRIMRSSDATTMKPLSGDYYFLDDNYAVVCGAGGNEYYHGTPRPYVAEVIPIKGNLNIRHVVEDTFKLTYLNFGSPGRSYSIPAPVRLAHESASELSSGVRRYGGPY